MKMTIIIFIFFIIIGLLSKYSNCYITSSSSSSLTSLTSLKLTSSLSSRIIKTKTITTKLYDNNNSNQILSQLTKQGLELKKASDNEMNQAEAFLSSQMYEVDMPNVKRKELQRLEYADLVNRYGGRTGIRKYPSALLLATENDEIIGMVGIDCQIYDENEKKFIPMKYVTSAYLEQGQKVVQVLANLTIRRDKRKKGLGKLLMKASADTVKSFGYNELYLQVDSTNKAAQALYKKEGYKQIFSDSNATCVVSGQWGLQTKECINLGYVKKITNSDNNISFNPLNNFFNLFKKTN